jgi:hypothetical protein
MVAVLVLAVIAVVVIKSLMSVVARDEAASRAPWSPDHTSLPAYDPTTYDPTVLLRATVRLRATVHDDVRGFLLPAVPEPDAADVDALEVDSATEQTRSQR